MRTNTNTNQKTAHQLPTKRRPAQGRSKQTAAPDDSADRSAVKLPYCVGFQPGDLALLTRTLSDGNAPDGPTAQHHPGKITAPRVGTVLETRFGGELVLVDFVARVVWVSAAALEYVSFTPAGERLALEDEIAASNQIAAALNGDDPMITLCQVCGQPTTDPALDMCDSCIARDWDRKCAADVAALLESLSLDPGVL